MKHQHILHDIEPARLELEHVTVAYYGQAALDDVTWQVPHGAQVAVVGPNGAGKSTLFKALVGLLPLRHGRILIHGQPLGHHQDCVAYVPQREEVDWRFPVTVADVVMMGRYGRLGRKCLASSRACTPQDDRDIVARSLEQMGITHLSGRQIGELSGGQQQRVFLARALAQEPHILLMDEPFTGVDAATQEATLALLEQLHKESVTVLASTHDLGLAASRFDQVALLNRQLIGYGPAAHVFTPPLLEKAFSGQMLHLPEGMMVVDQCCPPGGLPPATCG